MSIAPPSDIILDVAQAADPLRLQAATSKLNSMAAAFGSSAPGSSVSDSGAVRGTPADFSALLVGTTPKPAASKMLAGSTLLPSRIGIVNPQTSPYRKFEATLLQTFVQEILPKDENLFGDAASADICRSMLAEQLATQLSRTDRFGIARMIEKAHGPAGATTASAAAVKAGAPGAPAAAPLLAGVAEPG